MGENMKVNNPSESKFAAYMKTLAITLYNAQVTSGDNVVRPGIYTSSALMFKETDAKLTNKYTDWYFGTEANHGRLNFTGYGVSLRGEYTTPWLLPTVKDMFAIFGESTENQTSNPSTASGTSISQARLILENSIKQVTGSSESYQFVYWTSNEYDSSSAWCVLIGSNYLTAKTDSKTNVNRILPIVYF